jgi:hypothetical protein
LHFSQRTVCDRIPGAPARKAFTRARFRGPRCERMPRMALLCVALLFTAILGSVCTVLAQSTGASARLQQVQVQLQQLRQTRQQQDDRRQRLLGEQKKLLDQQAQLRKEIPLLQKELKKPLSPEQRDQARCKLRDKNTQYDRERRRQTDMDQQLAQIQQQSNQTQQQLTQTQQQVTQLTQEARQEQDAEARASDPLQRLMTAPATPLGGLPVATVPTGRRLIVLDALNIALTPGFTFSWDPGSLTVTIDSGGLPGFFANHYLFTMSDGSIQNVRWRVYRDSIAPPIGPVGLIGTAGPALMNAQIADTQATFGVTPFSWPVPITSTTHATFDVPDDPSIEPATFYLIVK